MSWLKNFNIVSYLLGLVSGVLLWWLVGRFRKPRTAVERPVVERQAAQLRGSGGLERYVRQTMLVKAQQMHLAQSLFPLDAVAIKPLLMASPYANEPAADSMAIDKVAEQVVPFLPDWPELGAQYNLDTLTLEQAIQNDVNAVLVGQPGSGRTTALAYFTIQLARRDPTVKKFAQQVPVLFHILDLNLKETKNQDPIENIANAVSYEVHELIARRIPRYLHALAVRGRLMLLIDGLDELPVPMLEEAIKYLETLLTRYPKIRMVVTGSPVYLDGLIKLGFFPHPMAAWRQSSVDLFIRKWIVAWDQHIVPQFQEQNGLKKIPPHLLVNWLRSDFANRTPMEWVLRIWSALAGDIQGSTSMHDLESYIQRVTQSKIPHQKMEGLAYEYLKQEKIGLLQGEAEKTLARVKVSSKAAQVIEEEPVEEPTAEQEVEATKKGKKSKKTVTRRGTIYTTMLNGGLLVEHLEGHVRFAHQVITGYLASFQSLSAEDSPPDQWDYRWVLRNLTARYMAARSSTSNWISNLMATQTDPLFQKTFMVGGWLSHIPTNNPNRAQILRYLAGILNSESVPFDIRAKVIAAFVRSNDASLPVLFQRLLNHRSPVVRQLTALGCGAILNKQLLDPLIELLGDANLEVRLSSCLAFAEIELSIAPDRVVEVLLYADEELRRTAAESLAARGDKEHEVLKEAAVADDILARRAAVFGLTQVKKKWAVDLLEQIAVEDSEWFVRNAASQAVESLQLTSPHIPKPPFNPVEAPWLIEFAAKQGMSISPNLPPIEALVMALQADSAEVRQAALYHLRNLPDEDALEGIYSLIRDEEEQVVRSAGFYTLWFLALRGMKLPSFR